MADSEQIGFRMQLSPGQRAAYQARHDAIWPELLEQEIMRRWWRHMADIMRTEPDGAPVSEPLPLVFHMDWSMIRSCSA